MIPMLIADDNAAIIDILTTFATPAGFSVTAARIGSQGCDESAGAFELGVRSEE